MPTALAQVAPIAARALVAFLFRERETSAAVVTATPADIPKEIAKPGCTVADELLLAYGHMSGLGQGWGGFGVTKETRKHLETASRAAVHAGRPDVSSTIRDLAFRVGSVADEAAAKKLAGEIEPLLPEAWAMAKRCGGTASKEVVAKAQEYAQSIREGRMSREQAVSKLRELAGKP